MQSEKLCKNAIEYNLKNNKWINYEHLAECHECYARIAENT